LVTAARLRPMAMADLERVTAIERACAMRPWARDTFANELSIPFSRSRVADLDAPVGVVGFVVWWRVVDEVHLLNLGVDPEFRRAGLGRRLLRAVLEDAVDGAASCVTLEVATGNAAALRLYDSEGFIEVGRRKDYYSPGSDALLMKHEAPRG
jgi:[ribosomal protein S18]-alanine N-acetyltransferase